MVRSQSSASVSVVKPPASAMACCETSRWRRLFCNSIGMQSFTVKVHSVILNGLLFGKHVYFVTHFYITAATAPVLGR